MAARARRPPRLPPPLVLGVLALATAVDALVGSTFVVDSANRLAEVMENYNSCPGCTYLQDPITANTLFVDRDPRYMTSIGVQFRVNISRGAFISTALLVMSVSVSGWVNGSVSAIASGSMSAFATGSPSAISACANESAVTVSSHTHACMRREPAG
jgi:hypothetical protein